MQEYQWNMGIYWICAEYAKIGLNSMDLCMWVLSMWLSCVLLLNLMKSGKNGRNSSGYQWNTTFRIHKEVYVSFGMDLMQKLA